MSEGIITCISIAIPVIIGVVIGMKKRKKLVKLEDADVPGQIKAIKEKVVSDMGGYKTVPAISKQSFGSMMKDSLRDTALSKLTGHRLYSYEPEENFVIVYGKMQMFFVPVFGDQYTKEIKPDFERITQITVEDLRKVKSNEAGSSITLVYEGKEKFLFGTLKEFYFPGASAKAEREEFAEFIHEFENSVNNK